MHSQAHDVGAPPVLEALRSGTALLHVALEKRLPFFSPQLDHTRYKRLLQAYYGFYNPLETTLHDSGLIPVGFDQVLRRKAPTLLTDLHALGLDARAIAALPHCLSLPLLDTPAACLGALYVLEAPPWAGKSCAGKWPSAWDWMPTTAARFSTCTALKPVGAGKTFSTT